MRKLSQFSNTSTAKISHQVSFSDSMSSSVDKYAETWGILYPESFVNLRNSDIAGDMTGSNFINNARAEMCKRYNCSESIFYAI